MIKIFSGNSADIATAEVIYELGRNNTAGSNHYVIVPDRFSLSVEKEIFERLDLPGACNIDVVSFTRLAVKLLKRKAQKCLSKEGAVIVLRKVIDRVRDKLVHYKSVAGSNGFPKDLYAVIASIRNSGYTADDLEAIASGDAETDSPKLSGSTQSKMQDVALVYREYIKEIENEFEDSTTRIDKLIQAIPTSEKIPSSHIYLVGFSAFSGKQKQIISALAKHAKSVNVAICNTNFGKNQEIYPTDNLRELNELAKQIGVAVENKSVTGNIKEPFNTLNRNLFTHSGERFDFTEGEKRSVSVYRERNVFEEINGIAHEIVRLVRREGYRYKDIAIVNCESANTEIVKSIFGRFGIPLYTDIKYALSSTLCAKFLTEILDCAIYNFRRDKTLNLAKEPALCISDDARENFENTVLAYNINFGGFEEPFRIRRKHPSESDEACMANAEEVRKKIVDIVCKLPNSALCKVYCDIILKFLEDYFPEGKAEELLAGKVDDYCIAVNAQAAENIRGILEELSELAGADEMSIRKFHTLFTSSVAAVELSLIPQSVDSVFMGDIHESRYNKLRALFVICATSDNLPAPHAYQAIISMTDMDKLEASNFRLYPTPADLVREEKYLFLELMTKPSDRLYIGGSVAAQDGTMLSEPAVCKEICEIMDMESISLAERYSLKNAVTASEQEDFAASPDNATFELLANALRATAYGGKDAQTLANIYISLSAEEKAKVDMLLGAKADYLPPDSSLYFVGKEKGGIRDTSVSEIECFYSCPYRHHLQYGLRLKEREEGKLRMQDVGVFIHGALENYFNATKGKLDSFTEAELSACADDAVKAAMDKHFLSDEDGMLDTVNRKAVVAEAKRACLYLTHIALRGNYRPAYNELKFGYEECGCPAIEIRTDNGIYHFRGSIDRMDTYGNRSIIIDYKTGHVEEKVRDGLYYGNKLQVILYQDVAKTMGFRPSGTFYVPIRDSADKSKKRAVGEFDVSSENIKALDNEAWKEYLISGKCKNIDGYPIEIKYSKDGHMGVNKVYFDSEQALSDATEEAKSMVRKALIAIEQGVIKASPLEKCGYCSFAPICKGEGSKQIREAKTVNEKNMAGGSDDDK